MIITYNQVDYSNYNNASPANEVISLFILFIIPMITLDPALDKLRNKELSFWLHFSLWNYDWVVISEWWEVRWKRWLQLEWLRRQVFLEQAEIIWHALTWGRIEYLSNGRWKYTEEWFDDNRFNSWQDIVTLLDTDPRLYDQTEIERMTSPKRPELRELLVKFAEYI